LDRSNSPKGAEQSALDKLNNEERDLLAGVIKRCAEEGLTAANMHFSTDIYTVDQKRRLVVNVAKNLSAEGQLCAVTSPDGCVLLMPSELFANICRELSRLSTPSSRLIQRAFEDEKIICQPDAQSRIRLSAEICRHLAGESKPPFKVKLIPSGTMLEIWNPTAYRQHLDDLASRAHERNVFEWSALSSSWPNARPVIVQIKPTSEESGPEDNS